MATCKSCGISCIDPESEIFKQHVKNCQKKFWEDILE